MKLSLLFWLISNLWIYYFHCYSMLFLLLYLNFTLHRHPDSPHFSHFFSDSPHSHVDSLHPHSQPIPRIPTLTFHIFLIPFSNSSFWLLQIACSVWSSAWKLFLENSCFSSKTNTPLFYYYITLRIKLLFTSSITSSVLLTKLFTL